MEKSNSGMHGHDMPIETKPIQHKPLQPNGNEMPTKGTETTTTHQSETFPFIIVEKTTSTENNEMQEFMVAVNNCILSSKVFATLEETEKYINSKPWDLIVNLIGLTIQIMKENEEFKS